MTTYLWDPFAVLERVDRDFDAVVRGSFGRDRPRARRASLAPAARTAPAGRAVATFGPGFRGVVPSADVVTAGDDVVINLELPGLDVEKDVAVEIARGRLVVRGERGSSTESTEGGRIRRESWHGSFRREFALPESVAADKVVATYDRGVLSVRLPGAGAVPASTRVPVTTAVPSAEVLAGEPAPVTTPAPVAEVPADEPVSVDTAAEVGTSVESGDQAAA
ncbi:Hsp20 family protein [Frankia sp. AgB1.9]|uniref:Hsp20/alpha crystallin family protein n=1 Tax=unclassified Frankia TaxID=2632575 RepID=UPI0019336BDA|nr:MULTISPECIES: Hsp20/alpha crystallin family protein [unclassified Frankia]MBL7489530.1 Hsp20 family protein [Frankia sp. AgW1.1]MBL7547891.1 Hsp20 family protein [Frankia sp. AgB1.9]MBL7621385.1 Hsp20 family protein [Frankia sp. AgB1.8]